MMHHIQEVPEVSFFPLALTLILLAVDSSSLMYKEVHFRHYVHHDRKFALVLGIP